MSQFSESDLADFFDKCARERLMSLFTEQERMRLEAAYREWKISPGDRIIEPGCGSGRLTEVLATLVGAKGKVYAFDISGEMIKQAEARRLPTNVTFIQGSALKIEVENRSFDHAICFHTFPHLKRPLDCLKEIARVLKHKGNLWITHLASRSWVNEFHSSCSSIIRDDLIPPDPEMISLLDQAGFETMSIVDSEEFYQVHAKKIDNFL